MSFHLYTRTETSTGLRYELAGDLKLSGSRGLLAGFLQAHASEETPWSWSIPASRLLEGMKSEPDRYEILLDLSEPGEGPRILHRLVGLRGSSGMEVTDLVLVLRPLNEGPCSANGGSAVEVSLPLSQTEWLESLGLTGGTCRGAYRWSTPRMNIGAAIYPARRSA